MQQQELKAKREEFRALLGQVASFPRPFLDYSKLSNATFADIQFARRLMEVQSFFMAHFRATGKLPATEKDIGHILVASMNLTPTGLAALYCGCSDTAIVSLLAHLKIEELFIGAELEKRLGDKRIGTVMILVPFFEGSKPIDKWQWLTNELGTDKIKYHGRDRAKENHDLRVDSVMRALEMAANLEAPSYEPGPLPPFPLDLHPAERSFWNTGLAKAWRRGHETLRKGVIPVLDGDAEHISRSAANYPSDERKKARLRWKMLHGINRAPASAAKGEKETVEAQRAAWRAEWDISELAAKEIHPNTEAIHAEVNAKIGTPEDSMAEREIGAEAYDYALSRLGERGRQFLDELIASEGNVSVAAKAAGISRVTGHKWRTELQILLSKNKLTQ
jgi:hypothetical protein